MTKPKTAGAPAPTAVRLGTTPASVLANLRIVDAATGKDILKVIEADSDAGKVTRYDLDADCNMLRVDNAFQLVEEDRTIRIEWIEPPLVDAAADAEVAG